MKRTREKGKLGGRLSRLVVIPLLTLVLLPLGPGIGHANPAVLDSTCDGDGIREDLLGGNDIVNAVALDSSGRTIVVGSSTGGGAGIDFAVARYTVACGLDTSFAPLSPKPGVAFIDVSGSNATDQAADVAVQPDGKIVAAGYLAGGTNEDIGVIRLNPDGSLDTTFSGDGIATIDNGGNERAHALALQPNGKIVIGGRTDAGSATDNDDSFLARLNANGAPDSTFGGGDGKRTYPLHTHSDTIEDVAVRPDGRIMAVGWANTGEFDYSWISTKPDGSPDTTFSGDGILTLSQGVGTIDRNMAVVLDPAGNAITAGFTDQGGTEDFAATSISPTGAVVANNTFPSPGADRALSIARQQDGKLILAGFMGDDVGVMRVTPGLALDPTFNTTGMLTTSTGGSSQANDVVIQPDGKIVIGGPSTALSIAPNFLIARYEGNPPIQFASPSYLVNENAGTVTVTVQRLFSTADTVGVHYSTANMTAAAGSDYIAKSGTLTFGSGVTTQTISISIINDALKEVAETFKVVLDTPGGGAALGAPSSAVITIRASDQQPDGVLKVVGGSYIGNNIYNTTGSGQTVQANVARGTRKVYYVLVYNDGNVPNAFRVKGAGSTSGFVVRYFLGTTATSLTNTIVGGTYNTGVLNPGTYRFIRLEISVARTTRVGSVKSVPMTLIWAGDTTKFDVVKANAKVV